MQSSTNSTVNRSTHDSSRSKSNTPALRVIPLGGLHEIGKNTCVFEYGDELMLVDAGLAFPSDGCLLYTSPSPRDRQKSRMPSSA